MLLLTSTSDIVRVITGSASDIEVYAAYIDNASGTITPGRTITASITTATTTTVVASPGASTQRNVKYLNLTNNHASQSTTVAVEIFDGTNAAELRQVTLLPGENLALLDSGEWKHRDAEGAEYDQSRKMDMCVRVVSDVTNATTSFADVTGLTVNLLSGKKYVFEAVLFHSTDATTTGARFGINIGAAPTAMSLAGIQQITSSVTAATYGSSAMVTARDTAAVVETTGPGATNMLAIIKGFIQPSADGTFAVRCQSEVAVAGGLVVRAGSWLWIREVDN